MINDPAFQSHPAGWEDLYLLDRCASRRQRRSGPGGQHRNKVETAVVYEHVETGVIGSANEKRSQEANHKTALFRLRINLALAVRCEASMKASELWNSRVCKGRIKVNPQHQDFPTLLSEVLDLVVAAKGELQPVSEKLSCTKSQLFKFLKLEPRAAKLVNDIREPRGLRKLK